VGGLQVASGAMQLDEDEQSPDPASGVSVDGAGRGRLVFEDVSFSYSPDKPLISSLSLVAEPGQTVAIVGPTGAGKTTLVNLMMRFYELDAGRITLDGVDVTSVPRRELRSRLGMVLQDTWLFGGTIRDNIAYGRPSATEDEILEAARAFLARPSVLILDEATSSVDTRTEVLVQKAMSALRSDRPVHDPRRRPHPGNGGRPDRGAGDARFTAGCGRCLCAAVRGPVRGSGGGGLGNCYVRALPRLEM
jgi:ABC-type multidrug transport system fused ATPase/permease subunit